MYLHSPVRVRNICGILEDKNIMRKILSRLSWYLYWCKYLTYGLNVYAHVVHTVCIDITYILLKSIKWTVKISEMTFLFPFLSGYVLTFMNMFVSFWLYLYHSGFIASFWWYISLSGDICLFDHNICIFLPILLPLCWSLSGYICLFLVYTVWTRKFNIWQDK
jgi:hypothetical protein